MNNNYQLSKERQVKENQYIKKINEIEKKQGEISKQIGELRVNKSVPLLQRRVAILENEIKIEQLEDEIQGIEYAISQLYISEIDGEIVRQYEDGKKSLSEQANERRDLNICRKMMSFISSIDSCEQDNKILDLRKQLEIAKKNAQVISGEEADKNIMEIESSKEANDVLIEASGQDLAKEKAKYDKIKLTRQEAKGEITKEEAKKRRREYQEKEPTREEVIAMYEKMREEFLSERQEYIVKAKDLAKRSSNQSSIIYNEMSSQDINKEHKDEIYRNSKDLVRYLEDIEVSSDTDDKKEKMIGKRYASIVDEGKKELANIFGVLDFRKKGEEESLLSVEKINNISPRRLNQLVNGEMFVATYEKRIDGLMKPIKEYYSKNAEGKIECIGVGDEEETKFSRGNNRYWTVENDIIRGNKVESLLQHELVDKVQKNTIQKDIKSGQVLQISKIMDMDFLEDFVKQCGFKDEAWSYNKDFYVISTIDEKGNEQYEVVYEENGNYTKMQGINQEKEEGKEIRISTPYTAIADKSKTLQEFSTKNGSRYAITRDEEDNIVFSEIIKEHNRNINARAVDSYSFTKEDIIPMAKQESVSLESEDAKQALDNLGIVKEHEKGRNK